MGKIFPGKGAFPRPIKIKIGIFLTHIRKDPDYI
jgi:hypothetical protein